MHFFHVQLTCNALDGITNQLSKLRTLIVGTCEITSEAATSFPQTVTTLELQNVEISEEALLIIFKRCTQLAKLELNFRGRQLRKSLFLQHLPVTLEDLSIEAIFDVNTLQTSLPRLTKLRSFCTRSQGVW
jgi:hypothetical protein